MQRTSLVSVFVDYRCNFECAHCSVGSSPRTILPMPDADWAEVLRGVKELPDAKVVVFTGGEPTMRMSFLLQAIRDVTSVGLMTRVVTNAWWAKDLPAARRMTKRLVDAGLTEMNTSFDDYHAEFNDIDRVLNLVEAAYERELRIGIGVIAAPMSTNTAASLEEALCARLGVELGELRKRVFVLEDLPTPTGTGATLDVSDIDNNRADMGCSEVMKTVAVHPDGTVKACCGHAQFYSPDLTLGSIREHSLAELVDRGRRSLPLWWIHRVGPAEILRTLGVEGQYSSICHACQVLLSEHRDTFAQYMRENAEYIVAQEILAGREMKAAVSVALRRKDEVLRRLEVMAATQVNA